MNSEFRFIITYIVLSEGKHILPYKAIKTFSDEMLNQYITNGNIVPKVVEEEGWYDSLIRYFKEDGMDLFILTAMDGDMIDYNYDDIAIIDVEVI